MASWPSTLPAPQKNIGIVPGDTRIERKLQSGRTEFRRFGNGKPDQMKVLFRLTWTEWDIFKEFHAHELNLGINWFSADWLTDLGYDAHKARILGYPREIALQSFYVDVLCVLIIQATADVVIEDTVWPCEPTGAEPEPPPPDVDGYLYGGYHAGHLRDCDKYVVDTDAWSNMADMPLPGRSYLAASTIDSAGYIYGGYGTTYNDCDKYTPNSWTSKTNLLQNCFRLAASTIGSSGYIYGGTASPGRVCDRYTPLSDAWSNMADMPLPARSYLAASTISDKGYIYGGFSPCKDCDEYDPISNTWSNKTDMPLPTRYNLSASTIGNAGYVYGGATINDCDEYVPTSDIWTSKANMLEALGASAAFTIGSAGYVNAETLGNNINHQFLANTWTAKTEAPLPGRQNSAASAL